jgi:hypothetical protein
MPLVQTDALLFGALCDDRRCWISFVQSNLTLSTLKHAGVPITGERDRQVGHTVKLMPPAYVKAYVKRNKTDAADAEAICEAVTRPTMRFVPVKSPDEQAAGMVLKTRELLVRQRSQTANAMRAHLAELGIIAATGMTCIAKLIAILRRGEDERLLV